MEDDKSIYAIAYFAVALSGGFIGSLIGLLIGWIIWG